MDSYPSASEPIGAPPLQLVVPSGKVVAVWVIFVVNVLVWLAMTALGGSTDPRVLVLFGAKYTPLILQGQVWRLVTPIFVHIGIVHLAFNSYAIYAIGPQIERFFGTARFLSIYFLSGAYGVLASVALSPSLSAGASGAIFGLIGAQATFFYRYRKAFGWRGQRQFQNTISVIIFNLIMTFTASGIDIWGHVGGLLAGAVLSQYLMPRYKVVIKQDVPELIDDRSLKQWGMATLAAFVLLSISLAGIIFVRRMVVEL